MEWLFAHMDDPGNVDLMFLVCFPVSNRWNLIGWIFPSFMVVDIDDPIPTSGSATASAGTGAGSEPSAEQVSMLVDMGFTPAQGRKALRETVSTFFWFYPNTFM